MRYVNFSVTANYLDIVKIFLGLTVSFIQDVCAEFGIFFFIFDCWYICTIKRFSGKKSSFFSTSLITNNLFAQHCIFLVLQSYLLTYVDDNLISVSATFLSTPYLWWILWPNYSILIHQRITRWDSLRIASYTKFYDLKLRLFHGQIEFLEIALGIPILREVPSMLWCSQVMYCLVLSKLMQ